MDAFSGYHQIPLAREDQKTTFIIDTILYCYKVMPFGLKNAGATYQRLVNKVFAASIRKTIEVYVNDMITKSVKEINHITNLKEAFKVLRHYEIKLNPRKCTFEVTSEKFLGYMIDQRGIEANPDKVTVVLNMKSPMTMKDVRKLTGCSVVLGRFMSRSVDKCLPFFKVLKKKACFGWDEEVK